MFKKPLSNLKTSAPLRSSDRRKLKQRVVSAFNLSSEDGDLLVPDGIQSVKYSTHLDEPGVAYLSAEGDPLWFTIGKGSDTLIPTIYTLWKKDDLLPFLSTPAGVIPVLVGGADLMIPGVTHHTPSIPAGHLVSIRRYSRDDGKPTLSVPLAVGRMALPSNQLQSGKKEKGKAVHIQHTWKDYLWDMGSKADIPEGKEMSLGQETESIVDKSLSEGDSEVGGPSVPEPEAQEMGEVPAVVHEASYTPQEITELLQNSLIQAISTTLSSLPVSSFPITSTILYTNYILPSRPAFPPSVLLPAASNSRSPDEMPNIDPTEINIKASTHKSLTTFLKAAEKLSLITTKSPQKHSQQTDLLVTSVNAKHPLVAGHTPFATVKDLEARAAKKAANEEKERGAASSNELEIKELWKPHQASIGLFQGMGGNTGTLYSLPEIRTLLLSYIASHKLINQRDKAYINVDDLLLSCISAKSKGKSKGKEPELEPVMMEFMKRDELIKRIMNQMQSWHEVRGPGRDPVQKKGALKPVQVVVKVRQGRKASTLITDFELFQVIEAEEMAEELRKLCAGATSVSPVAGKPAGSGLEVLVQGKQSTMVVEYLMGKGIPKKWIEVIDLAGKK